MRNLGRIRRSVLQNNDELPFTNCTWDLGSDSIICAYGPTKETTLLKLKRWQLIDGQASESHISSWDAPCPLPDLDHDRILDIHFFPESSTCCLVLAGGDIVVVRETALPGEEKIEIVGSVDVGISAAAWSPDEELLVITTRADTLLYMSREFENIASVALTYDDLEASKHVSVGWGKSETQFKGRGAKALRDPTIPEKFDSGLASSRDDRRSTISWRGDGAYVALSSLQASNRRVIRVYTRDGALDGVSEPVDHLEGALSWRPSGNLLAGIQRFEDRVDVIFFERNGLRHGQFSLRLDKQEMDSWGSSITLKWNVDSSVLAICFTDRVQLWTMGNYHYYLKQEIILSSHSADQDPLFFVWHPEHPLVLAAGCGSSIERQQYILKVSACSTMRPHSTGTVAVIDGRVLKLTPLRYQNVPPPMATHEIYTKANIIDSAIWSSKKTEFVAALDHTTIYVYQWTPGARPIQAPQLIAQHVLLGDSQVSAAKSSAFKTQQIRFLDPETLMVAASTDDESTIGIYRLYSGSLEFVKSTKRPPVQDMLMASTQGSMKPLMLLGTGVILDDPTLLESGIDGEISNEHVSSEYGSPRQFDKVEVIDIRHLTSSEAGHQRLVVFGLTRGGSLFANDRLLARDCTSFVTSPAHLIYTTSQHLLKFVHMAQAEDLEVPPDEPEIDERCRSIERGARIVTVIPPVSALILQMPRGNLETIYPRALVLAEIRQSLNDKKYKNAFVMCRKQRVDMNILHDHAPEQFLENVEMFLEQVSKVEYIDLFLSQLREEDVSKTMYKETLRSNVQRLNHGEIPDTAGKTAGSKVNRICDAFLTVLRKWPTTNLQNIITSHVCKSPPDLEAGLLEVAKLQRKSDEDAERAVEHICFLADVNKLYDYALGLYDLDLALLVAQQSQKDPREYLPFLQHLRELPELRREYNIDNHLGRFKKALQHLHGLQSFDEFTTYMVRHNLYEDALLLNKYQEDNIREILRLYADHLLQTSRYKDSGIAYEYLKDYGLATESYRLAHLWRESLSCATLVPLIDTQMQSLALAIADSLVELKDFHSAATIHQDYLHDIESSARLFCKGYYFADAIRLAGMHRRTDLIESIVDASLVEGMAVTTELLAECKAQLNAQVPRLRELRIKKAEEPLAFYDADVNGGADIPDNVSLAATNTSTAGGTLFTRYTSRTGTVGTNATRKTSKNRKREERKRARGKKGSVYEEEYLVNSIRRLIDRVNAVGDEVARLVTGLMRRGMRERARAVEAAMTAVVTLCRGSVDEVFQTPARDETKERPEDQYRPPGADGVLFDSMEETETRREAPVIKAFEKLSLLGN